MNTNSKEALTFDEIKKIILDSGVLDEHDKNVGGDLYSPKGNQELTADALAQYIAPRLLQDNEDTEVEKYQPLDTEVERSKFHASVWANAERIRELANKPSSKVEKLKELQEEIGGGGYGKDYIHPMCDLIDILLEDEE